MALVGSLAFQPEDQEDNDFFEQLASDLGNGELDHTTGLDHNFEQGETEFNEVFSKLNINTAGSDAVENRIGTVATERDDSVDYSWLEESVDEATPSCVLSDGDSNKLLGVADAQAPEGLPLSAPQSVDISGELQVVNEALQGSSNDPENTFSTASFVTDVANNKQELMTSLPVTADVQFGMQQQGGDFGDKSTQQAQFSFPRADGAGVLGADPSEVEVSTDLAQALKPQSSTNVKELQWSTFSEVFSSTKEQDVFGSYSDFISDLDTTGTGGSIHDLNSKDPGEKQHDLGAVFPDNHDSHAELSLGAGNNADQTSSSSVSHFSGTYAQQLGNWNSLNERGLHTYEIAEGQSYMSHNMTPEDVRDPLSTASYSIGAEGELQKGLSMSNGSQEQASVQQSGWYFDYATYEWKQLEGWDSGAASVVPQTASGGGDSSQFPSSTGAVGSLQTGGTELLSTTTDLTAPNVQEQLEALGSMHGMVSYGSETSTQLNSNSDSSSQQPVYWSPEYPGWYWVYETQEWRHVDQSPVAGEYSEQKASQFSTSNGLTETVSSSSGLPQEGWVSDPSAVGQVGWVSDPSAAGQEGWVSDPSAVLHQGWASDQVHADYQQEGHQNIHGPGRAESLVTGGGATGFPRGMSFASWAESSPSSSSNQPNVAVTQNMGEALHARNSDSWNEYQNHGTSAFDQFHANYAVSTNSMHFSTESPFNMHQHAQHFEAPNVSGMVQDGSRSSAGRPAHALVAFGFGGKLLTMKISSGLQLGTPSPVVIHDLSQLVLATDHSVQKEGSSYFSALSRPGLVSPLVGGGATTKELLKWIDERAGNCEGEDLYCSSPEALRILWGVLKIACLHYGKLRSMVTSGGLKSQAEDGPEVALGRLFAAVKSQSHQGVLSSSNTLQLVPTEHQLQAIAADMKRNLMEGKRKEALQLAQQGQLWGPALVLAWQLGEKVYADTVAQMAQQQFVPGSPLRTLFLLFAGQATELFTTQSLPLAAAAVSGPLPLGSYTGAKDSAGGMLGDWLENLSIIAANPTKGDEQVITHLGDCLWKEHGEVAGAHTCYLVAEADFESFSQNARLCLVGADHFKYQRTFVTPQAIQRTEVYEYAKMLGNPQYILVPFQPFKLVYAHMLTEAGKIAEACRYCQAVIKTLKNAGRAPEVEVCRQAAVALEERLRLHTQGGYSLNAATHKFMEKFIGTIDSTIHRIIGGPPPQVPDVSQSMSRLGYSTDNAATGIKTNLGPSVSNNSLVSAISQAEVPARSVSEPDLSRSPLQDVRNPAGSEPGSIPPKQGKSASASRYRLFSGNSILAMAVGFIKPNKTQAKLGDKNKFYYDEKLKRWVEEGAEQNMEEIVPPPPPMTASFSSGYGSPAADIQNGTEQRPAAAANSSPSADMPPMPPSVNQFSARGRLQGVRSRYVDTFNKGSAPSSAKSAQSSIVPTAGWGTNSAPAQFFMPSIPTATNDSNEIIDKDHHNTKDAEGTVTSTMNGHSQIEHEPLMPKNLSSSFMAVPSIPRHSSAGNFALYTDNDTSKTATNGPMASSMSMSRAVSWSGNTTAPNSDLSSNKSAVQWPVQQSANRTFTGKRPDPRNTAVGLLNNSLPSPPVIEPPTSYAGVENSLPPGAREPMFSGTSSIVQEGFYGEMQEVEL